MKWIYSTAGNLKYNPVCVDVGKIEKIVFEDSDGWGYHTDMDIYTEGMRFSTGLKPVAGRCFGFVSFYAMEYLNPKRSIDTQVDMEGEFPDNGTEIDMRGIWSWEGHTPICADPRIMYVFNILCDSGFAVGKGISERQYDAICREVFANIPDTETAIEYHKRFGYPLGKRTTDSSEYDKWYRILNTPPSQEKIDFLLSLIK